jgi:hypothetical protein
MSRRLPSLRIYTQYFLFFAELGKGRRNCILAQLGKGRRTVFYVSRTVFWQELAEYSSGNLALQDDPYTPSTHTSLESPRNGGINGYFTFEHGLLQGEPFIITSKWGC